MTTIRDRLFTGFESCSNHDCIIKKRTGMGTNGSCQCLQDMGRAELNILKSRLQSILDLDIEAMENCLIEIQQMCVGELTMGCRLDPDHIGSMIYEKTGIKQ